MMVLAEDDLEGMCSAGRRGKEPLQTGEVNISRHSKRHAARKVAKENI